MWVKRLSDTSRIADEIKYEVCTRYSSHLVYTGGDRETLLTIQRYYKDNDGNWQFYGDTGHVTVETLMSDFVLIDSPVEKEIQQLREFKGNIILSPISNN